MKVLPAYPSLYQINTRVWLTEGNKECRGSGVEGKPIQFNRSKQS